MNVSSNGRTQGGKPCNIGSNPIALLFSFVFISTIWVVPSEYDCDTVTINNFQSAGRVLVLRGFHKPR